jgi:flavin reductase (DIM6/NTAB) family NADH-FMN oxidoreductase RutF
MIELVTGQEAVAGSAGAGAADELGVAATPCRDFFRTLAASVTVVTSRDRAGPVGMTASAVTSLSLRPPLLLTCLAIGSATLAAVRSHRAFAVGVLHERQQRHSAWFARAVPPQEKFDGVRYAEVLGVPVLADALAWAVCFVEDVRDYGDHSVVVGRIAALRHGRGRPLLWHDRAHWRLSPREPAAGPHGLAPDRPEEVAPA